MNRSYRLIGKRADTYEESTVQSLSALTFNGIVSGSTFSGVGSASRLASDGATIGVGSSGSRSRSQNGLSVSKRCLVGRIRRSELCRKTETERRIGRRCALTAWRRWERHLKWLLESGGLIVVKFVVVAELGDVEGGEEARD